MKLRLFLLCCLWAAFCNSQDQRDTKRYTLDINQYYGSILLHNNYISHLITNHPGGLILSYNQKSYGDREWQQLFNYPDTGVSFIYQNMNNPTLGRISDCMHIIIFISLIEISNLDWDRE